jgi:hypothetical protein
MLRVVGGGLWWVCDRMRNCAAKILDFVARPRLGTRAQGASAKEDCVASHRHHYFDITSAPVATPTTTVHLQTHRQPTAEARFITQTTANMPSELW